MRVAAWLRWSRRAWGTRGPEFKSRRPDYKTRWRRRVFVACPRGTCDHRTMQVGPFLAVAAIVVITPGVDMALVTRNALMYGRRSAVVTALGINAGILFWVMAAALGLAAVVSTSATAFAAIKLAGAAYLVYLGIQALRSARTDRPEQRVSRLPARLRPVGWPSAKGSSPTFSTRRSRSSLRVFYLSSSARTARPATCFCSDCCSTRWALAGSSATRPPWHADGTFSVGRASSARSIESAGSYWSGSARGSLSKIASNAKIGGSRRPS